MNRSLKNHFARQDGAALVTVILVSLLLGTACVALLTAVSAGSRNTTDALSEYKAYYAAESGLQAAVDVLRHEVEGDSSAVTYSEAAASGNFATWLGSGPIAVGSGDTQYTLAVMDPDFSSTRIIYSTQGTFDQDVDSDGEDDGIYASTRTYGTGLDTLTISYVGQGSTQVNPATLVSTPFGSFQVVKSGSGPSFPTESLKFRIDYSTSEPRAATRTIRGTIGTDGAITFTGFASTTRPTYSLLGSDISLSNADNAFPAWQAISLPAATTTPQTSSLYGDMTAIEPYRLKVTATGVEPATGAKKILEAIVQRNFLNDLNSTGAISMIGPNAYFRVGTSNRMEIDGGAYPSITVSDQAGLDTVNGSHTNGTMLPPPEIQGNDVPDWQQSAAAMDALIQRLRQTAQNSGRYFNGTNPSSFGNANGTGITFCEGSCSMGGNTSGGGILVVTGTFSTSGNPTFNGLVLAVGRYVSEENPGGVIRSGGGNELFTGNIVIAPYNPDDLLAGFEQPRYDQSGGPGDTVQSDVEVEEAFNGTSSITDFILGVAEK